MSLYEKASSMMVGQNKAGRVEFTMYDKDDEPIASFDLFPTDVEQFIATVRDYAKPDPGSEFKAAHRRDASE